MNNIYITHQLYIHTFILYKRKARVGILTVIHRAVTEKQQCLAWQLGTAQCWTSLRRLHAPPSVSWDPASTKHGDEIVPDLSLNLQKDSFFLPFVICLKAFGTIT